MRVLIADDDLVLRHALTIRLQQWGYEPVVCADGREAREVLRGDDPPPLAILDWNMPFIDGLKICTDIRTDARTASTYVVMLTGKSTMEDVLAGLDGGVDEYLVKPFDWRELRARVANGARVARLQQALAARVAELQDALSNVRRLTGLLPMCSYCKRIRDDKDYWQRVESYLSSHSDAEVTHGICPECFARETEALTKYSFGSSVRKFVSS
jgi:sigma-B regulation protein RsbU (phosphoserine phosphatase)